MLAAADAAVEAAFTPAGTDVPAAMRPELAASAPPAPAQRSVEPGAVDEDRARIVRAAAIVVVVRVAGIGRAVIGGTGDTDADTDRDACGSRLRQPDRRACQHQRTEREFRDLFHGSHSVKGGFSRPSSKTHYRQARLNPT